MMRARAWVSFGAAALLAWARPSYAGDDAELQGLLNETVITTASKAPESSATAPATSTTITAEDLRRYGIHSLDEALDFLALGVVTSNPLSSVDVGSRGVMLAGDQGRHFLLLVNGHAMNDALYGAARFDRGAAIPMEMVDHIEVILGAGSVLYGSNAMLGVINVITKRARDYQGAHVIAEAEPGKSYRLAGGAGYELGRYTELTFQLDYYKQSGPALTFPRAYFGIDVYTRQPVATTPGGAPSLYWGGAPASRSYGAEVPSALARFVHRDFEVNVGLSSYKRTSPYDKIDLQGNTFFDDADAYELDRHVWLDAKQRVTLSPNLEVKGRLYGDTFDYQRYADSGSRGACDGSASCRLHVAGASRWAGLELQSSYDWLADRRVVTLVGVDGRLRTVAGHADTTDYVTGAHVASTYGVVHGNDQIVGAYVEQTVLPRPWFDLNGGARLDASPHFNPVVSPRVAASVRPWKKGTLKWIYAEAFRAPNPGDTSYSSPTQIAGGDLRPETVRSVEASAEQKFGAHRLMFGVFRSWLKDLIELHQLTQSEIEDAQRRGQLALLDSTSVTRTQNVASVANHGFNGALEGSNDDGAFHYGLTVTGSSARRSDATTATTDLRVTPHLFGNARASYDLPGEWPTVGLALHWMDRRASDERATLIAPRQLEARLTISGALPMVRGLSYRLSANVVLADQAPYVVGPHMASDPTSTLGLVPVDRFRTTVGLQYDFGK